MASIIVRTKILPEDISIEPDELLKRIGRSTSKVAKIKAHAVEPIAFGLNALIVDFMIDDAEGGTDPLEESLSSVPGIGSMEILGVSRASTRL